MEKLRPIRSVFAKEFLNNKKNLFFILLSTYTIVLIFSSSSFGYQTQHILKSESNLETLSLGGVCSTLMNEAESINCQPALIAYNKEAYVSISGVGKGKGKSIDHGKKLLLEKIEKPFVEQLFTQGNYNSFTFNSNFQFFNPYFLLSYSPYFLLADILIQNPAFPEISMLLMKRATLKLSSGLDLSKYLFSNSQKIKFAVGGSLYHYTDSYYQNHLTLLELASSPIHDLIQFQQRRYFDMDIGSYIEFEEIPYLPSVSFVIKNLASPYHLSTERLNSPLYLESKNIFERRSEINLGYNLKFFWGGLYLGILFPYQGIYQNFYDDQTAIAGRFNIGPFSLSSSYSQFSNTLGLITRSDDFAVGIHFSREKELDRSLQEEEDSVYVGLEVIYK